MMRAVADAPPLGISAPRSTVWARGGRRREDERDRGERCAFHCTTRVRMISSLTLPPERIDGALVEILSDVLQSDRALDLRQCDGAQIGEFVAGDFCRR